MLPKVKENAPVSEADTPLATSAEESIVIDLEYEQIDPVKKRVKLRNMDSWKNKILRFSNLSEDVNYFDDI